MTLYALFFFILIFLELQLLKLSYGKVHIIKILDFLANLRVRKRQLISMENLYIAYNSL